MKYHFEGSRIEVGTYSLTIDVAAGGLDEAKRRFREAMAKGEGVTKKKSHSKITVCAATIDFDAVWKCVEEVAKEQNFDTKYKYWAVRERAMRAMFIFTVRVISSGTITMKRITDWLEIPTPNGIPLFKFGKIIPESRIVVEKMMAGW